MKIHLKEWKGQIRKSHLLFDIYIYKRPIDRIDEKLYYCNSEVIQFRERGGQMNWILDKKRPLCPQICEQICVHVACGRFAPGERLMSVREVAVEAGVNPNTVQRSFEVLEGQGVLYSVRGSGWYVSEDITAAKDTLKQLLEEKTAAYFAAMSTLGLTPEETKKYVEEWEL